MSKDDESANQPKYSVAQVSVVGSAVGDGASVRLLKFSDVKSIREWWHSILRKHGRYQCSAVFLLLPSDKNATEYFAKYGRELHILSGSNCLILAFGDYEFKHKEFDDDIWYKLAAEHVSEGYSLELAKLFEIEFSSLPCVLFFRDIRDTAYTAVSLKNMSTYEIAEMMRDLFGVINLAVSQDINPLEALKKHRKVDSIRKFTHSLSSKAEGLVEKSLTTVIEAWIKASMA